MTATFRQHLSSNMWLGSREGNGIGIGTEGGGETGSISHN